MERNRITDMLQSKTVGQYHSVHCALLVVKSLTIPIVRKKKKEITLYQTQPPRLTA